MSTASAREPGAAFTLFLFTIAIVAWPLGSNRDWIWPVIPVLGGLILLSIIMFDRQSLAYSSACKRVLLCFVGLIGWMFFQLVGVPGLVSPLTIDSFSTRSDLLKTIGFASFFASAVYLMSSRQRIEQVLYVIVLVGVGQAIVGAIQQLVFDVQRASGSFPNPNHFAGYLEMSAAVAIGLLLVTPREQETGLLRFLVGPRGRLRLLLIIIVAGLVMSRSRMGNLGFLAGLTASALMAFWVTRRVSRGQLVMLGSILLLDLLIVGSYFGIDRLNERMAAGSEHLVSRIELQAYNLEIVKDHPLAGTGAGTYEFAISPYRDQSINSRPTHAENDYLELLVENGIVGFSLFALLVLLLVSQSIATLQGNSFDAGVAFGCFMSVVCLLIHGLVDVNLQIPSNALTLLVILAVPFALERKESRSYQPNTLSAEIKTDQGGIHE